MRLLTLFLCITLAACAQRTGPAAVPLDLLPFNPADHEAYKKPGAAQVTGEAFLRQKGGGVVTCAGSKVLALPATPYFRRFLRVLRAQGASSITSAPEGGALIRSATCNARGGFAIADLPPGPWIVLTEVRWTVASRGQGGAVGREIEVPAAGAVEIILGDGDLGRY